MTIIKFYSDQKIRIRIALVDGEAGIIKAFRNNFNIESLIRCNFHLKHETLNSIQKYTISQIHQSEKEIIVCSMLREALF